MSPINTRGFITHGALVKHEETVLQFSGRCLVFILFIVWIEICLKSLTVFLLLLLLFPTSLKQDKST